ncbi:hypothetical protein AX15_001471 [Amanita polypyramis BW_CC]|nr:hypothetical protein AX15_001471 [Amanita polypyramis BW_CC]
MFASLLPLPLSLDLTQHTRWTATQENTLQTYPLADEGAVEEHDQIGHNIVRIYLQFLWLPESIMPLSSFVPAMASASTSPSPTSPHPLHALLEPLIMAPRTASSKYHADLLQILDDGGGAGEIEEHMMWFALGFEKGHTNGGLSRDANIIGNGGDGEESEPWRDETWRKSWLERMEQREVQIQVLLHFVKLSLPGPKPPGIAEETSADKIVHRPYLPRGHRLQKLARPVTLSTKDELEAYMDKMSMWQLMQGLDVGVKSQNGSKLSGNNDDDRDWIQVFVEDVVEKQFRPYLPDLCDLFHDKVFPAAPASDTNDEAVPDVKTQPDMRANSPAESELASVFSHSVSAAPSVKRKNDALGHTGRLSRSRSLSVSLQQERESQRDATNQQKSKKRALNREVSMSRVFRAKSKGSTRGAESTGLVFGATTGLGGREKDKRQNSIKGRDEKDVTLVQATPVKNKIKVLSSASAARLGGGLKSRLTSGHEDNSSVDAETEVDVWESELPKSTDIIMGAGDPDGDIVLVAETPKKVKPTTTKAATWTKMANRG